MCHCSYSYLIESHTDAGVMRGGANSVMENILISNFVIGVTEFISLLTTVA